jgi:hypothetical protein
VALVVADAALHALHVPAHSPSRGRPGAAPAEVCDYGAVIISGLPIADGKLHTPARGQGLMRMSLLGTDGAGPWITGTGNGACPICRSHGT